MKKYRFSVMDAMNKPRSCFDDFGNFFVGIATIDFLGRIKIEKINDRYQRKTNH